MNYVSEDVEEEFERCLNVFDSAQKTRKMEAITMTTVEGKEEIQWSTVEGMETLANISTINRRHGVESAPAQNFCAARKAYSA